MNKLKLLGFTCLFFSATHAHALLDAEKIKEFDNIASTDGFSCEEKNSILFGNGIDTSQQGAVASLLELQAKTTKSPKFNSLNKQTDFHNIYNPTVDFFNDLLESAGQKLFEKPTQAALSQVDITQVYNWLHDVDSMPKKFKNNTSKSPKKWALSKSQAYKPHENTFKYTIFF